MAVKIDDIDRRIILLLQQDGRMSARDISRRLGGIGDRAVRYRIDRLVRSGAISVIAVVDNEVVGYPVLGDVIIALPPMKVRDTLTALAEDEPRRRPRARHDHHPDRGTRRVRVPFLGEHAREERRRGGADEEHGRPPGHQGLRPLAAAARLTARRPPEPPAGRRLRPAAAR